MIALVHSLRPSSTDVRPRARRVALAGEGRPVRFPFSALVNGQGGVFTAGPGAGGPPGCRGPVPAEARIMATDRVARDLRRRATTRTTSPRGPVRRPCGSAAISWRVRRPRRCCGASTSGVRTSSPPMTCTSSVPPTWTTDASPGCRCTPSCLGTDDAELAGASGARRRHVQRATSRGPPSLSTARDARRGAGQRHVHAADELARAAGRNAGLRGIRRVRELVRVADARAESPMESRMRWRFLDSGLPAPEVQLEVSTGIAAPPTGPRVARGQAWAPSSTASRPT